MAGHADKQLLNAVRHGKLTRERSCKHKHAFTQDKAIRQAKRVERETHIPMKPYPCLFCDRWHIAKDRRKHR